MIDFEHRQAAHCENGVTRNLLKHYGIDLSEPMVFGIGSGLFFSYLPFIRVNYAPVVSFRPLPGIIFKRVTNRLGIKISRRKYREPDKAMQALDNLLEQDIPAGMLAGVFYLTYFPQEYRFHFNAHNIVVFGRQENKYLISDPVMEKVETLTYEELKRVRYAKGTYPPKGRMYYIASIPGTTDIRPAIIKGMRQTCRHNLDIPLPLFGVRGIRYLAKKMRKWPVKFGDKKARIYLGQVIRMLEEIGTGGAGFRFIFAAFLQEAADILGKEELRELSAEMTATGDKWREFALMASRNFKQRKTEGASYNDLADRLLEISKMEKNIYTRLKTVAGKQ
ncbi:MAG: BtrH N-terminal domain-containing protein [Bacteroidetes bacterium]|nr:BtrH N-terminal domain-containing protein [Bacteroidota bacterium]